MCGNRCYDRCEKRVEMVAMSRGKLAHERLWARHFRVIDVETWTPQACQYAPLIANGSSVVRSLRRIARAHTSQQIERKLCDGTHRALVRLHQVQRNVCCFVGELRMHFWRIEAQGTRRADHLRAPGGTHIKTRRYSLCRHHRVVCGRRHPLRYTYEPIRQDRTCMRLDTIFMM